MKEEEHRHIVRKIRETPGPGNAQEREAEYQQMQQQDAQAVGKPDATTVEPGAIGVDCSAAVQHGELSMRSVSHSIGDRWRPVLVQSRVRVWDEYVDNTVSPFR